MANNFRVSDDRTLSDILNIRNVSDPATDMKKKIDAYQKALRKAGVDTAKYVNQYEQTLLKENAKLEREETIKALKQAYKDTGTIEAARALSKEMNKQWKKDFTDNLKSTASQFGKAFSNALNKGLDAYMDTYSKYMGSISARLQGSGLTYRGMLGTITGNLATSPYVKQTAVIENLNKFVESGITYNLELRAYLATVSDKIATTFNAFDSSLLRIIRIQQADSTTARLGMEALLTEFLNANFGDTSYLNTTASIKAALLEAESQMSTRGAAEFEYSVQRWLGSLSAVGVGESTLGSIAAGLGYLGSGNLSALSGNQALLNLFTLAAGRSGLDIGQLLKGGLTGGTASQLLGSIVGLAQQIGGTKDLVTRSAYAEMFGLNLSDITAIMNLTSQDLVDITKNMATYQDMLSETQAQISGLASRTTVKEMVDNLFSNVVTSLAGNIAQSAALYSTWKVADLLSSSGLDYTLNLGFLGTGTSTSISQIMRTGVVGISGIQSLAQIISGLTGGGNPFGTSLAAWGQSDVMPKGRGGGLVGRTTSASAYIGAADASVYQDTFTGMAEQTATYTGQEVKSSDELLTVVRDDIAMTLAEINDRLGRWEPFINRFIF